MSVRSVVDRESIVRKIRFPRLVIPAAVVLTATFNLALNLVVVLDLRRRRRRHPAPRLVLHAADHRAARGVHVWHGDAALGAVRAASATSQPIWEVVLQALFYATPILYPIETVQDKLPSWRAR